MIQNDHVSSIGRDSTPLSSQDDQSVFSTLLPGIQKAVVAEGYTTPTPIQEKCIPLLLEGHDLIGTAQTGTGKTAAFVLPLLQRLAKHKRRPARGTPRALILAPTRELAAQIAERISVYGRYLQLSHTVIFGGVKQNPQVKALNSGVDILVATPGRLLDLMQQGFIHLKEVEVFILDEVDRMLDMGFIPDIKRVLAKIPANRQTLFFSATMAPTMEKLANTMVSNPIRITIAPDEPTVDRIEQKVMFVDQKKKNDLLISLFDEPEVKKVIVFTQMKHMANRVVEKLATAGIEGAAIHGNKSQAARTKALSGFKNGRFKVLVATDVAARGIDVDDITHVVNYDLPRESETYVHRIGRTARAGADGDAISFCAAEEISFLHDVEKLLGQSIPVDVEHEFHSKQAQYSTEPPPKQGGGGRGRGGGGRGGSRGGGGGSRGGGGGGGGGYQQAGQRSSRPGVRRGRR